MPFAGGTGVFSPSIAGPEAAAFAVSGSSALVAENASLLKCARFEGIDRVAAAPAGAA